MPHHTTSSLTKPPSALTTGPGVTCHVDDAWCPTTGLCGLGGIFTGTDISSLTTICKSHSCISSALMAEALAIRCAVMTAAVKR
ncbi:hypothetical protein F2Q69_00040265 [Brassica cretica]|uniref:RNase H type-1 domain-containing protein n=1 Tax=Brassica cretica TaxID=69181 RepID=A0A8S9N889_BRACR|nr:hypothetical protein F2Q69_00040265 [Brassica cretica]